MKLRFICIVTLASGMAWSAYAVNNDCIVKPGESCQAEDTDSGNARTTLREKIDKAKGKIADNLFGLQLSAFGDVVTAYDDAGSPKLELGAVELEVSGEFGQNLQSALAVVRRKEETKVAAFVFDYHTFGGRIAPRGRLWVEKGFHIQLGRFDVPFGNDFQFLLSKDSVSISRPLTTEIVMEGGYNDDGVRILGNNGSANFNLFLLRGFNQGRLLGGRLGLTPLSNPFSLSDATDHKIFEFGFSYLFDGTRNWEKNEVAYAVDSEIHLVAWTTRMEYLNRKKENAIVIGGRTLSGWHITQEYETGQNLFWPTTIFARYENARSKGSELALLGANQGDEKDVRITAGFNTNFGLRKSIQWKLEVQHYLSATPSTRELPGYGRYFFWYTQLVWLL
jgi:hypothetical protein